MNTPTDTIVDGCILTFVANGGNGINITGAATRTTITKCSVTQIGTPNASSSRGIQFDTESSAIHVSNNSIINTDYAIYTNGLSKSYISGNKITCSSGYGIKGISLTQAGTFNYTDVDVLYNVISGLSFAGAQLVGIDTATNGGGAYANNLSIVGNKVHNISGGTYNCGVRVEAFSSGSQLTVKDNQIKDISGSSEGIVINPVFNYLTCCSNHVADIFGVGIKLGSTSATSLGVCTYTVNNNVVANITDGITFICSGLTSDHSIGSTAFVGNTIRGGARGLVISGSATNGKTLAGVSAVSNVIEANDTGIYARYLLRSTISGNAIKTTGDTKNSKGIHSVMRHSVISGNSIEITDYESPSTAACIDASEIGTGSCVQGFVTISGNTCHYGTGGSPTYSFGIRVHEEPVLPIFCVGNTCHVDYLSAGSSAAIYSVTTSSVAYDVTRAPKNSDTYSPNPTDWDEIGLNYRAG
jgi:hypothetical protein